MKVAIGSSNPAKISAVKDAFKLFLPDIGFEFITIEVDSGIADQPMSDHETYQGARQRANQAIEQARADYGVGIEGGLQKVGQHWVVGNLAVVIDKSGKEGFGISTRISVPANIMKHVHEDKNLSHATQLEHGIHDIGKKEGILGMFSKGLITRSSASKDAVIAALSSLDQAP